MSATKRTRYEATAGRRRYLGSMGLPVPKPAWWQATGSIDEVDGGLDFLCTIEADQWIDAPAAFLGEGMEDFRAMVHFDGAPLAREIGDADTVMERLGPVTIGEPVRTRLVAFGNVSTEPIEFVGKGQVAGRYDLYVTLSPTVDSFGEMTLFSEDGNSGTFASTVSLAPLFELRPVDGGESIFVDTGQMQLPGFPMELASSGGHWARAPHVRGAVANRHGQSLFYPGKVSIVTQKVSVADGVSEVLAACEKRQAILV